MGRRGVGKGCCWEYWKDKRSGGKEVDGERGRGRGKAKRVSRG